MNWRTEIFFFFFSHIRWEEKRSIRKWDACKTLFQVATRWNQFSFSFSICMCIAYVVHACMSICECISAFVCMYVCSKHESVNLQAMGMAGMLEEIINYVHSLQNQVEVNQIYIRIHFMIVLFVSSQQLLQQQFWTNFSSSPEFSFFRWSLLPLVLLLT